MSPSLASEDGPTRGSAAHTRPREPALRATGRKAALRAPLLLLAIVAVVGLGYARSLQIPFLSDDHIMLADAASAQDLAGSLGWGWRVQKLFLRPISLATWKLDHALWGDSVAGYHADMLCVHALAAWMLGLLVYERFRGRAQAWIAALVFASFPLNAEAVAWLAARADPLCALFVLAALWAGLRYVKGTGGLSLAGALVCAALALMCKEMALTLPLLALILAVRSMEARRGRVYGLAALLAIECSAWLGLRWWMLGDLAGYTDAEGESLHARVVPVEIAARLGKVLELLAVPGGANQHEGWLVLPRLWPALVLVLGLCLAFVRARGAAWRALACHAGMLLATLAPLLSWVALGPGTLGARTLYLPACVWCTALAAVIVHAWRARAAIPLAALVLSSQIGSLQFALEDWRAAGALGQEVSANLEERVRARPEVQGWAVVNTPETLGSAYVFRAGLQDALERRLGRACPLRIYRGEATWRVLRGGEQGLQAARRRLQLPVDAPVGILSWNAAERRWIEP